MSIYINRDGQRFGPYSIDAVNHFLKEGRLMIDDAAWCAGQSDWMPLGRVPGIHPPSVDLPPMPSLNPFSSADTLARRISDYERISGMLWIVLGVIQVITIIAAIAGIWNILAGISRVLAAKPIAQRDSSIPKDFEDQLVMLIVIGVINLLLGGVIGILFVAFDFYIRDLVLKNRHLFNVQTNEEKAA